MNNLITLVVPIKNSFECVSSIIEQVIKINSKKIELVINDNSEDNSAFLKILEKFKHDSISYYHQKQPMSMTENFELGIKNAKGKYVCILGADDNVSTRIIDVAEYLNDHNIESAVFRKAAYNWPGMKFRIHQNTPDLTIFKSKGNVEYIDVKNELIKLLKQGMTSLGKLPEPYHGIIKKDLFDEVFLKSGCYIPGASPDMAMAVSLAFVTKSHVYIDAPITISGHSYNSAGGKGARGQHKGDLKNKSFLPEDIEKNWPSFIPKVWTSPTVYADSLVSSLRKMDEAEFLNFFNKEANYANLIVFFPEYLSHIKPLINNTKSKAKIIYYSFLLFLKRGKKLIENWLSSNLNLSANSIYNNVNDSYEASKVVDKYLESNFSSKIYLFTNQEK